MVVALRKEHYMIRFLSRRSPRREPMPQDAHAPRTGAEAALQIEELEPRLTPDYVGTGSGGTNPPPYGGGTGTPGRTVGWGC